ncbi:hypothetical protein DEO72_LG5g1879 [Vigna unguiculata]|uniref:Uncharacterized protein n=1 Tax=Vigna unguiculata TaxID=3917 RepID=A0A4D6LZ74_VIGUN|nr:hypothetical protein DEO72_LG5g1879 [Vigna unguiculata]
MASVVRGTEAIDPLLAPGLLGPRPIPLTSSHFLASGLLDRGLYPSLAPVLGEPGPIPLFGFGYLENRGLKLDSNCKNATAPLHASVSGQPRHIR